MLDIGYNFGQINPNWTDTMRVTRLPAYENEFGEDGSTFASVLSAAILLDSADSLLVANTGTLSATTMASGDIFAVKATVATTSALRGVSCAFKYYERYV